MIEEACCKGTLNKKITVDLSKRICKSNLIRVISVFCICQRLLAAHMDPKMCACSHAAAIKLNPGWLHIPWTEFEEVLKDVCTPPIRSHGIRIGSLFCFLQSEHAIGTGLIVNHFRWASINMLLYYSRERARYHSKYAAMLSILHSAIVDPTSTAITLLTQESRKQQTLLEQLLSRVNTYEKKGTSRWMAYVQAVEDGEETPAGDMSGFDFDPLPIEGEQTCDGQRNPTGCNELEEEWLGDVDSDEEPLV
jgi:hypothetical protein